MNEFRKSASDANYHSRHSRRTLSRAECIAAHIKVPSRVLDVGCNNGITSQYLLDTGKATHVTGVELHASTVDKKLLDADDFELLEGNIVDIELQDRYDFIIYGAVHHHILNFNGLTTAVNTLRKLVAQCDGSLFFETGQIGEGGRWRWQRAIRKYFRTDEEHFFYLLRSIEQEIEDFEVIGKFWIHGIRRSYLRIDIGQSKGRSNFPQFSKRSAWPNEKSGPFGRTFGSRGQSLSHETESGIDESPSWFWTSDDSGGQFIKLHRHHPIAATHEASIGEQLDAEWAVRPLGITEDPAALIFPWLKDAVPVDNFTSAPESARRRIAAQVLEIFADARTRKIRVDHEVLMSVGPTARVIDVCDLHANNLLVTPSGDDNVVRVVDFEQQGVHYAYRNRMHLARILWRLKQHRIKSISNYLVGLIIGFGWLLRYQAVPLADRIRARQPSLISVFVAEVRSKAGRMLGVFLEMIGFGE